MLSTYNNTQEYHIDASFSAPPAELAARLTKPSASYKNSARLAVAGLLLFVGVYFALAGWFLYTPYQIVFDGAGSDLGVVACIMAACSLFVGVFMVKAIFSVRNATPTGLHEVTPKEQPRLFAYLFELADAAGAPRPHKVFVSARVNAAVFYDLSLFNLIFPSKKNLEIGLGLVNTLSLGELRAVLAHEFGHFAQRSMAVGRWVYVAQQIADHLVTRRDALDDFLVTLGNIDLRIRAVVAVVQLIIWSIRSLIESLFRLVVLMQRALSREMEMQADLVAVSLTGSDALVHALHKMQGADDAWDRALHFIFSEHGSGRNTSDVFAVQTHMIARMSAILNDDGYAKVPPLPGEARDQHRIFKAGLAQPPKMWLTHPLNHDREANAKRIYVPAAIDPSSAWSVFNQPVSVREQATARLLGESQANAVELEESLKTLAKQFKREQYNRRYCGVYFGRPLARHADKHWALRDTLFKADMTQLAGMYPDSLIDDIATLRVLESESGQIEALIDGSMTAPGGVVHLRGVEFRKKQLPAALERVRGELEEVNGRLYAHDKLCRSWHQDIARQLGGGWDAYLEGLLALVHYAEHTAANVQDARGMLRNVTAVETALRTVSAEGVSRVVFEANELHFVMEQAYKLKGEVFLDARLCERLELTGTFGDMLGEFTLPVAYSESINEWLGVIDGWVDSMVGALNAVRTCALEELLVTETMVVRQMRQPGAFDVAPEASRAPATYPVLLAGAERKRQTRLGWWARFQRADGILPGTARLVAAGAIVAAVLGAGTFSAGHGTSAFGTEPALTVHNGLGIPVTVTVDGRSATVPPASTRPLALPVFGKHHVEARNAAGVIIDNFDAEARPGQHPVYNVAGAAPMVEASHTYGKVAPVADRVLGTPRWFTSNADHMFSKPPSTISGSRGSSGGYRTVLEGYASASFEQQMSIITDDKERMRLAQLHARWDPTSSPNMLEWLAYSLSAPGGEAILAARLKETPRDVLLRRAELDAAPPERQGAVCLEAKARAEAEPEDGDLAYLALRCAKGTDAAQWRSAQARWPANIWIVNALAYDQMHSRDFTNAVPLLEQVSRSSPFMAHKVALELARIKRYTDPNVNLDALAANSERLRFLIAMEQGDGEADGPGRAYSTLGAGRINEAIQFAKGDAWREANVLRLAAASDRADQAMITRALALPADQGISPGTAWTSLALALREGRDGSMYVDAAQKISGDDHAAMLAFLKGLAEGKDPQVAERLIDKLDPESRAYAWSAGVVLMGRKAPPAWRNAVRRLLFASERPYFG